MTIQSDGPYKVITHNNNNGLILIEKSHTDIENINMRRVSPYYCAKTPTITTN